MNETMQSLIISPLLTPAQAAGILGVTIKQLAALRRQNLAPKSFMIGRRLVRFDRAEVEKKGSLPPQGSVRMRNRLSFESVDRVQTPHAQPGGPNETSAPSTSALPNQNAPRTRRPRTTTAASTSKPEG